MADNKLFHIQVVSPDRVFYENDIEMLEVCTTEGGIGVLAGHIPLTSIVAPGVARFMVDGEIKEAALHDGFLEILPDKVVILAESCEWPDEIDISRAREAKTRAERRLKGADGEINEARAELALRKALLRLELGSKYNK